MNAAQNSEVREIFVQKYIAAMITSIVPNTIAAPTLVLDVSVLKALVGDEPRVIAEFLHDFRVSASEAAIQLRIAWRAREAIALEAVAHRLKSSARSVGALALGELCSEMETAGQEGRLESMAELWPKFEAEWSAVDEFLRSAQA